MVGDINLFFHDYLEEHEAEINIMIGEQNFRGKGIAQKVLSMMMEFGYTHYNKVYFIAKIKNSNTASISLFKKMGFNF
jgi:RimJ/RimL family protein N-acetyltransferase